MAYGAPRPQAGYPHPHQQYIQQGQPGNTFFGPPTNNVYAPNVSPQFLAQVQRAQQEAALRHLTPQQLAMWHQQQQQQPQSSQLQPSGSQGAGGEQE